MKSIVKFLKEESVVLIALAILLPIICIALLSISNMHGTKIDALGNTIGNTIGNTTGNTTGGGSTGTQYVISTEAELRQLATNVNNGETYEGAEIILLNDIEVSSTAWTSIGIYSDPFEGTFNGNGYTISGITYTETEGLNRGLFGVIGENGIVRNLKISDITIPNDSSSYVGSIAAINYGRIENCINESDIVGKNAVGGIVGVNSGYITNCKNSGTVTGTEDVGGIAGVATVSSTDKFFISSCLNAGTVKGVTNTGGIVGQATGNANIGSENNEAGKGTIKNCVNTGVVSYSELLSDTYVIGGIVGLATDCSIKNSTNAGDIEGQGNVGGIAGQLSGNSYLLNSLVTGPSGNPLYMVGEKNTGVLVGYVEEGNSSEIYGCAASNVKLNSSDMTLGWNGELNCTQLGCELWGEGNCLPEYHASKLVAGYVDIGTLYSYTYESSYATKFKCWVCDKYWDSSNVGILGFIHEEACIYYYGNEELDVFLVEDTDSMKTETITAGGASDAGNKSFSRPTVSITTTQTSPTNELYIVFTIKTNNSQESLSASDIVVTNGAIETFSAKSATEYELKVNTIESKEGKLIVTIPTGSLETTNPIGILNEEESISIDMEFTAPTLTITAYEEDVTNASSITYTFTFSESVIGFTIDDIKIPEDGRAPGGLTTVSEKEYELTVLYTESGEKTVSVVQGVCTDAAGNNNLEASKTITIDKTGPILSNIEVISPAEGMYGANEVVTIKATFDENIVGTVPSLKLLFGGEEATGALVAGEIIDNTITWDYTIACGDEGDLSIDFEALDVSNLSDALGNAGEKASNLTLTGNKISAIGHNYQAELITPPTCTTWGEIKYTCTNESCGYTYSEGLQALEHKYQEEIITSPTCTTEGERKYICTNGTCGDTYTEKMVALGHTEGEAVKENEVAATCTTEGSYDSVVYCTVCNAELNREEVIVDKIEHTEVIDTRVEPTCATTGLTEGSHCSECNTVLVEQTVIEKIAHTPSEAVRENEVAATCTTTGSYDSVVCCSVCNGELSRETKTIDKIAHTEVIDARVEPTCTTTGLTEGSHCSVCSGIIVAQEIIAVLGHTESEAVKENVIGAICTSQGSYDSVVYCTVCNTEISRENITVNAIGHIEAEPVKENEVAATCTTEGSYDSVVYCSVCNAELSRETKTIDKIAHTEEIDARVEPTCTTTGLTEGSHCSVCSGIIVAQEIIAVLGHTESEAVKENVIGAICTSQGSYDSVVYCTVCNTEISRENITVNAIGHTEAEPVKENEVAATCTTEGSYDSVVYCSVCNAELSRETKTIDKIAHTEAIDARVEPTCTTTGLTEGSHCSECNTVLVEQTVIEKIAHTPSEAVKENEVAATCTTEGSYDSVVYCSVCNGELSRETKTIDKIAHTEAIDARVEPTCTTTGLTEGKHCSVCNTVLVAQTEIPAKGHTPGTAVKENVIGAICTSQGSYDSVVYCTVCNTEISRENITVNAIGHTEAEPVKENEVAATCTTTGSYDSVVYCSVCNAEISRESITVDALGHIEEVIEAKAATCTETGLTEGAYCSVCNEVLIAQEIIPALGHNFGYWIVEKQATYEEEGKQYRVCENCTEREEQVIPKLVNDQPQIIFKDQTVIKDGDYSYVKVDIGTTVEELKANIDEAGIAGQTVTVENLTTDGKLKTGSEVKLNGETVYTVVISGDLDGDGKVTFMGDVVAANNYRIGKVKLSTIQQLAADISNNGKVDFLQDIIAMNNYRLGIINSL